VEEGDRALIFGVAEIWIEHRELVAGEQGLVDNGAAGKRTDEEWQQSGRLGVPLHVTAGEVERPLPGVVILGRHRAADEQLPDGGAAGARQGTQGDGIDGDFAPPQKRDAVSFQDLFCETHGPAHRLMVRWQEEEPDAEGLPRLKPESETISLSVEEAVGNLGQEAGTVTGVVGRGRAAMRYPCHGLQRHPHDLVRPRAGSTGDEPDPAGVVFARSRAGASPGVLCKRTGAVIGHRDPPRGTQKRPAQPGSGPVTGRRVSRVSVPGRSPAGGPWR
jgi:hypothetical protein